jgi:hypothetical protein
MAQTQPAEKLHTACDECRKPLDLGSTWPFVWLTCRQRDPKVEVFREQAIMWEMSEGKDRMCLLAPEDHGSA